MNPDELRSALPEGLLRSRECAAICAVSETAWRNLVASGRTPAPIRLGSSVRWSKSEVLAWIAAGAPPRWKWDADRNNARKTGAIQ